ncbi:hypothetical protein GQ44DRAFT_727913 [Phaeosphaeriaceae sp. PMI808]|nr:hypothetical protein GQ44DRAFT_727913 [Phaeosphaeriaceae sp. PMI808]
MFQPSQTLWIILDRVERRKSGSKNAHRKRLLQAMVQLVLAVISGYSWVIQPYGADIDINNHQYPGASLNPNPVIDPAYNILLVQANAFMTIVEFQNSSYRG